MRKTENILVTGGSGFIGSNFIIYLFGLKEFKGRVVNVDALTYAGNPENLKEVERGFRGRYFFEHCDILETKRVKKIMETHDIDTVVHFAAESHVDRSIAGPDAFIRTNINGTQSLLSAAKEVWRDRKDVLFHHVSTDEVYGSLGEKGFFYEDTSYDPRSPYSASKAASDHLVRAWHHTYGLPVTISNCSNNYGPYQFPEKLIPLMLINILEKKPLPVYGRGENVRDWLFVTDHCSAIYAIIKNGRTGETYNVGGENEWKNIEIVRLLCGKLSEKKGLDKEACLDLITHVTDRAGHDFRYAINCDKIKSELDWTQSVDFEAGIEKTIDWYLDHPDWVDGIRSGEYLRWIEQNYGGRG